MTVFSWIQQAVLATPPLRSSVVLRQASGGPSSIRRIGSCRHRSVLITGGANGLGEAIARRLLQEGDFTHVTIADIDHETGRRLQADLSPQKLHFVHADVSQPDDVANAVEMAAKFHHTGKLHAVVNNAGIVGPQQAYADYDVAEWKRVIDINLNGVFYGLKYGLAQMMTQITNDDVDEEGGKEEDAKDPPNYAIVNMSSTAGFRGIPHLGPYTAAKWAVNGMTEAAAVEYASHRIRVNAIAPTTTETAMIQRFVASAPDPLAMQSILTSMNALPGFTQPDDIAAACSFLLSRNAQYITGHTLPVDAGALARLV